MTSEHSERSNITQQSSKHSNTTRRSKPMFSKRHYEFIADVLATHKLYKSDVAIHSLAAAFAIDNIRFSPQKFIERATHK